MKHTLSLLAIAALGVSGSHALSQGGADSTAQALTRQLGVEAAWEARLTVPAHAQREEGYAQLVEAALGDDELLAVLEAWAADASLGELAWTARLALREVELRSAGSMRGGPGGSPGSGLRRGLPGSASADPFGWFDSPFGQFEVFTHPDFMEEMRRSLESALQGGSAPGAVPFGGSSQSQSYSMQSGPDGVRVEVREDVDGDSSVTTYEAESLEQLLEEHPELRGKLGLGSSGGAATPRRLKRQMPRLGGPGAGGMLERFFGADPGAGRPRALQRLNPDPAGPAPLERRSFDEPQDLEMRTDRLGVLVTGPEGWDASGRGLDAGVGLRVERVMPGTLAELLGIRVGDAVVDVDGTTVRAVADVATALADRAPDAALSVSVVDAGGQRRTLVWKP